MSVSIPSSTSVIDLDVGVFKALVSDSVRESMESAGAMTKDTRIGALNVEQFTQLMVSVNETKAYLAAQKEQHVTERIFKDADGIIQAGVVPFRIKSAKDVDEFAMMIKRFFAKDGTGEFVVAAALLVDGVYSRST
jgi:hypothetical protein